MQLLVAYGADVEELADANALVEVTAFSASLELDDAVERLLQRCNQLQLDLDIVLEQGVANIPSAHLTFRTWHPPDFFASHLGCAVNVALSLLQVALSSQLLSRVAMSSVLMLFSRKAHAQMLQMVVATLRCPSRPPWACAMLSRHSLPLVPILTQRQSLARSSPCALQCICGMQVSGRHWLGTGRLLVALMMICVFR